MKCEIFATFYYKISTDKKPKHEMCPSNQIHGASGYALKPKHPKLLDANLQKVLSTIYEELSLDTLLQMCVRNFIQNDNEDFKKTARQIKPFIASCVFNEGFSPILKIMDIMGIQIGVYVETLAATCDGKRLGQLECLVAYESHKQQKARRTKKLN
ncbi:hypothetical protein J437_LFUL002131 [Ladona fulva]|uniref:Uncharacterized protein n=1 Tax=Ladona fulva TaxID=123851 RepID=A0A8K0JTU8_LADFU|nr:hypothetical protein J437_LFUL002131 [Ladona fulva]